MSGFGRRSAVRQPAPQKIMSRPDAGSIDPEQTRQIGRLYKNSHQLPPFAADALLRDWLTGGEDGAGLIIA
jgi:hypothetical protein